MTRLDPKEYLDRIRSGLVPIAGAQLGVCKTCHSGANGTFEQCYVCDRNNIIEVLPISMSVHGGSLHKRLRQYKSNNSTQRKEYTLELAALLYLFLTNHWECLGGEPDHIVTVPSPQRDAPKRIIDRISPIRDIHIPLQYKIKRDSAQYKAPKELSRKRVLLIDDTFTTGNSVTKAYMALSKVGAEIAIPIVIGRHFHPDFNEAHRKLMDCLDGDEWRLDRCGICAPIYCSDSAQQINLL